jgi:hypothetical protein
MALTKKIQHCLFSCTIGQAKEQIRNKTHISVASPIKRKKLANKTCHILYYKDTTHVMSTTKNKEISYSLISEQNPISSYSRIFPVFTG